MPLIYVKHIIIYYIDSDGNGELEGPHTLLVLTSAAAQDRRNLKGSRITHIGERDNRYQL